MEAKGPPGASAQVSDESVVRAMTWRAMTALGLLATLALGSLGIFLLQTITLESGARVLNLSGRQRMLSQRLALLADVYVRSGDAAERARLQGEIESLAERMETAHRGLVDGDAALGLPPAPASVREIYYGPPRLDDQVRAYLVALEDLVWDDPQETGHPSYREVVESAARGRLLATLDDVVAAFQEDQEGHVERLQRAKVLVFVLTLVVIVLTRRRVILPMARIVRSHIRALHQHHERLAHVSRLSVMGQMAAGIAHEINQPLTAIASYAQASRRLIEAGQAGSGDHLAILEKITRQAERASEVIRRVRAMTERRSGVRERVALNALVEDAVQLLEADNRFAALRVECELAPELPPVRADPVQIQQVLLNLVRNALEATLEAGRGDPVAVRTAAAEDGTVAVQVADRGPGVPAAIAPELFEPFATTREGGMGMGLSISRSIVEAHGGRLEYRPRPAGGSVFTFRLPG